MVRGEFSIRRDLHRVRRLRCQRSGENYRGENYSRTSKLFQGYSTEQFPNLLLRLPGRLGGRWASAAGRPDDVSRPVRSQREKKAVIADQAREGCHRGLIGRINALTGFSTGGHHHQVDIEGPNFLSARTGGPVRIAVRVY